MRHFRAGLLLLAFVSFSAPVFAQQATTTGTSDPQAVALIQRAFAALTGGVSVTDVTLTGTAQRIAGSDNETGTVTLKATALGDSRVDLVLPSGDRSEIRNHSATPLPASLPLGVRAAVAQTVQPVGAWSGPDGTMHGIANHNVLTDAAWFFPALTLARVAGSQNYVLSYVGQETHDLSAGSSSVLHISAAMVFSQAPAQVTATIQRLSQMDIYLDPATLLPVALAFNIHPDNDSLVDIPAEIPFSGYQGANGMAVPFHVQKFLNNGLVLDLQFTSVTPNSGLSAAQFQLQ